MLRGQMQEFGIDQAQGDDVPDGGTRTAESRARAQLNLEGVESRVEP